MILGGDRLSTNGNSYIDFELLQNTVTRNANGTFTSQGHDGGRTVNDLLMPVQFNNGGGVSSFFFYKWGATGSGFDWIPFTPTASPFAMTNSTTVSVPFGAFGYTTYAPEAFAEAAVNVSEVIREADPSNPCLSIGIKTLFIKTKASAEVNAELKDFIEPLQLTFNIGKPNTKGDSRCGPGTVHLTASASGPGTLNWYSDASLTTLVQSGPDFLDVALNSTNTYYVTQSNGDCESAATPVTGTINDQTTAKAGDDQIICSGSIVELNGTIGGAATSGTWTSSGTSTFSPDANSIHTFYTPSADDKTTGTVTLTLTTNDPDGDCEAACVYLK